MTLNSKQMFEDYVSWLRNNLEYRNISSDSVKIQTPFVDSHNDFIVIYVKKIKDEYILTDEGRTLFNLHSSGLNLTEKSLQQLKYFARAQGVDYDEKDEEICVKATWETLPQKKNDLIQSVINVGDMFLTAQSNVRNLFYEAVASYFQKRGIAFSPDVYLDGSGGVKHKIDFIIGRVSKPPQLVKTVNNPVKSIFEVELFKYIDISRHDFHYEKSEKIIFINDSEQQVRKEHLSLIKSYEVIPVLWSERNSTGVFPEKQ